MNANKFNNIYMKNFDKDAFASIYKSASGVLFKKNTNEEYVYEYYLKLLFDTINNEEDMKFIKQANDYLNVSPVYVWLKLNEDKIKEYYLKEKVQEKDELKHPNQSQLRISIGAFWGWVMKNNTSIRWNKPYCKKEKKHNINGKNAFGFKTAALFETK